MSFTPGFGHGLSSKKRHTAAISGHLAPRKRRRTESTAQFRPRKYHLEGKYCDGYRLLFNQAVQQAAARFETDAASHRYYARQIGASLWSSDEQATFYAALERLGKDNIPGIADAIGTKSIPETRAFLLLLEDAAAKQGDVKVTLRNIPAAVDVGDKCNEQLDLAADALAWNQEKYDARQEQKQFGNYWLITPAVAQEIEAAIDSDELQDPTTPISSKPGSRKRGGKLAVGACLACKKSKQKCDRKTPCGNCQKRKNSKCEYPDLPTHVGQAETPKEPEKPEKSRELEDKPAKIDILSALPEANLLCPQVMLQLSKNVFMNRSPTIPSPWPHWSEYISDIAQEPSIYRTAFGDLYNLVVSLTRRLVQTAIIQSTARLRSRRRKISKSATPLVRKNDVQTALDILGMPRNGRERWSGVARRCALRVYDEKRDRHGNKKSRREVPWDEFERTMTLVNQTVDILTMDAETSSNHIKARLGASRSGTPLPLEELALSSSDESTLDENAPASESQLQPRDLAGRYMTPSLAVGSEMLAQELVSVEQSDRETSRQQEKELWIMLGLEPPKDDGDSDDGKHSLSQDDKIITLPNSWRWWTDYHAHWEEFDTPPNPVEFLANQKPLTVPPVLHKDTTEPLDSGSDDMGASAQSRKQRRKELEAIELQAMSSWAYADRQAQALAEVEPTSATNSEYGGMSSGNSSDEGMNQPMESVDADDQPFPQGVSDDEDISMVSRHTVPNSSHRDIRAITHSNDELGEMDWNSFID